MFDNKIQIIKPLQHNPNVQNCLHNTPPPDSFISQLHPLSIFIVYFRKKKLLIILSYYFHLRIPNTHFQKEFITKILYTFLLTNPSHLPTARLRNIRFACRMRPSGAHCTDRDGFWKLY